MFEARASGDEAAHNDVFLEAAEIVHFAGDGRFREDAGSLLEARGGDERIGRERGLGDTEEERTARCGAAAIGDDAIVLLAEAELVHLLLEKERGVAHVLDLDPAHHLARDGLDVLVVDVDALETVNLLNGVDQVRLREFFAEDGKQVVEVERAIDEGLAGFDVVAFLNVDVHASGDGVFLGGLTILAFDVDFAHALGDIAIADAAVDFADDGRILGFAGFKELDNARETAGDVLGLGGFARDLCEHVAGLNIIAILDHQVGAGRHEVLLADLAGRIADKNRGLMLFISRRQSDNVLREAGHFVHLLFDRQTGAQVVKLHGAGGFSEDREGERIPFGKDLAVGDVFTVFDAEARAVNDVVALLLAVLFIDDSDQSGAVHGDGSAATAFDELHVHKLDDAVVARFERGTLGDARGSSADVEGAHGQLRAGFADGLGGDDADGFAKLNHSAGGEVASVTKGANAAAGFASEHGTNAHALDTRALHLVGKLFGDLLVHVDNDRALEILDLVERNTAHNAVAQRLDFDAGFDDRFDEDAVAGAAIAFIDDHVLCDVDEATGEVAGIGGLERRIGQALARAVRRDEVLQHGQPFAEVGGYRRFDDFAARLGHQTAHTGE